MRQSHVILSICLVFAVIQFGRSVVVSLAQQDRLFAVSGRLARLTSQLSEAAHSGALPTDLHSPASQIAHDLSNEESVAARTHGETLLWGVLILALVGIQGHLLLRFLSGPLRKSVQSEKLYADQERERERIEARERELRLQNRELARLAGTDALTGLPNRRALVTRLRQEAERLSQSGKPLGVLMIDIDHFKALNDRYGHAIGDEALRLVGQTIQNNVRGSDLAARYGGEEFVVLLPGANQIDSAEIAEVIREAIQRAPWTAGQLCVSLGAVSAIPESDGDALVRAADRALYEAKRTGRNRTVVALASPRSSVTAAK